MSDERTRAEGAAEESRKPPPKGPSAPRKATAVKTVAAWAALVALGAFVCVQLAGVLLRDTLEGRRPLLARAPAPEAVKPAGPAAEAKPAGPEPSRFGPEVQEIAVAKADAPAPPAPPPAAAPPAKVEKPAPEPPPAAAKAEKPAAPPPAPAKPEKPAPAPAKAEKPAPAAAEAAPGKSDKPTHLLLIDIFLSQQYLRESEQKLKALGLSSMRVEVERPGKGFRVTVAAEGDAERDKASKAVASEGCLSKAGPKGVEAYFYFKREAVSLAETLNKKGFRASVETVNGPRPYWKLLSGPYTEEEARKNQRRLRQSGVTATLEALP